MIMLGTDKPYTPQDINMQLDIADSTLRKWCLALEEEGYLFSRTDNNRRVFFDHDIVVLRHFQKLVQVQNLSMQNAARIVAPKFREAAFEQKNSNNAVPAMREDSPVISKVLEEIEQLKELNKKLINRLDEQQTYIEERLNKRDAILMESLREVQETKKLMIEQKQEEEKKKSRKGILKWFRN